MADRPVAGDTPTDRLTRLCDAMLRTLEAHPEYRENDQCSVFLDNEDDRMGGMVLHGYDDHKEAALNLFMHLRALLRAYGMDVEFIGIPDSPKGIDD